MNKHLLWVFPVGVAAGLSLPFVVPARSLPPPAPPLEAPRVTVKSFELKSKGRIPVAMPSETLLVERTDSLGTLASQSTYQPSVQPSRTRTTGHLRRSRKRLDSRSMQRIQIEDSRAWQEANRLLQYERRGA